MLYWVFTIFVLLHGLAHLVYTALALHLIPVAVGHENWTGSSWVLASRFGEQGARATGALAFASLTILFVITTIGLAWRLPWAQTWLATSAVLSSAMLLLFWDGSFQDLSEKGIIGLVINILLLILLFVVRIPSL